MAMDFPAAPANGATYTDPITGVVYTFNGTGWTLPAAAGGGSISIADTPPAGPAPGDLWWESDKGILWVFYNDGSSSQWVTCSLPGKNGTNGIDGIMAEPPQDGKEYARINGVWQLKAEGFPLAGVTQLDIPVPAWGPAQVRLTGHYFCSAVSNLSYLQISVDGTTFVGTGYTVAGFYQLTTPGAVTSYPPTAGPAFSLSGMADGNANIPYSIDTVVGLLPSSGGYFGYRNRGHNYHNANGYQTMMYHGMVPVTGAASIKALKFYNTSFAAFGVGNLHVEWLR
jgi:hypothetical protein